MDRSQSIVNININNDENEQASPATQKLEKVSDNDEYEDDYEAEQNGGQGSGKNPPENDQNKNEQTPEKVDDGQNGEEKEDAVTA